MVDLPEFISNPRPSRYLDDNFGYTVADFETTNRDKGSALTRANRIVLGTWLEAPPNESRGTADLLPRNYSFDDVRFRYADEFHQEELTDSIRRTGLLVAHNAKFELQWLQRAGLEIGTFLVWDTMLAEFVLAGNRRWPLSLDAAAARYGIQRKESLVDGLIKSGICPSEIPRDWLIQYGRTDTAITHQIFLRQREILSKKGLLPVMYTRCLLTPVLADIELRGVKLDAKRVKEEYERALRELTESERGLTELSGGLNYRSSTQVAGFVYGDLGFSELRRGRSPSRTPSGRPRTDAESIGQLKAANPQQREFQSSFKKFKRAQKKLETLEKLLKCVNEDDGILYAQFNQAIAGTHRLTSTGLRYKVQYQNIDHTLKGLFRAREDGWLVAEADGTQLEFRVAAHLGRDKTALNDIRTAGFDAHWQTAEEMSGKSRDHLTKEDRYDAKPYTFRPLYGATSGSRKERAYIDFFQTRYNGIYSTQMGWAYEVLKSKQLRTETGLIFYWPDCCIEPTADGRGYIRGRTAIFNYPVQSLATADIIPVAVVHFWHRAKAAGARLFLVNTIHDSIEAEVPPDESGLFRELAQRAFTVDCFHYLSRVYNIDFVSPLGCETKLGEHWGEGQEVKYDYDPQISK